MDPEVEVVAVVVVEEWVVDLPLAEAVEEVEEEWPQDAQTTEFWFRVSSLQVAELQIFYNLCVNTIFNL